MNNHIYVLIQGYIAYIFATTLANILCGSPLLSVSNTLIFIFIHLVYLVLLSIDIYKKRKEKK